MVLLVLCTRDGVCVCVRMHLRMLTCVEDWVKDVGLLGWWNVSNLKMNLLSFPSVFQDSDAEGAGSCGEWLVAETRRKAS